MMQQAGVPTGTSPAPGPRPIPSGPPPGSAGQAPSQGPLAGIDLLNATSPEDFPFIGEEVPAPSAEQPTSTLGALAATTQSSFAAAVLARLNQRR